MENNPVGWFEIYVEDMERAKKFYETVFQVKLDRLPTPDIEMWAFPMDFDKLGAGGALVHMPGAPTGTGGGGILIYFSCEDCGEEAARVADAGGQVQREKMSIGEFGHIALALDSEGNLIGMHSMK